MNPEDLPLEPLIAPDPVSWWPLAPLWWALIAIIILAVILIVFFKLKRRHATTNKDQAIPMDLRQDLALAELAKTPKPYDQPVGPWLEHINVLLKRLCAVYYPRQQSHTLLGQDWLKFLDSHCPEAQCMQYSMLAEGQYKDGYYLDNTTIDGIYTAIETWITHHV